MSLFTKEKDRKWPHLPHRIYEDNMEVENPNLVLPVNATTPLKDMVVNYIGERIEPEDGNVTMQMAIEVFATEFPEFLLVVAEENFLRGYQQALDDIENVNKS